MCRGGPYSCAPIEMDTQMKLSRILATGAAAALVGVSTFAVGGTATAADFYVLADDVGFVADGDAYLDSWFSGDVAGVEGTELSTASGLELTVGAGGYQLLNGAVGDTTAGLETLAAGASFTMSAGTAKFQVPAFYMDDADADATIEFTTLRPADSNTLSGDWMSSSDIMDPADDAVTLFAADTAAPLADLLDAMPDYEILAFGIFADSDATVASITWNGNTHFFTAEPVIGTGTATITPASLTVADFSNPAKGVTGVFTGFQPNEAVTIGLGTGQSGSDVGAATADADGVVTFKYVSPAAYAAVGSYTLFAFGSVTAAGSFEVTANVLPVTGADFTPAIVSGSLLVLLGAGVVLVGRRRAAAHRS